MARIRPVWRKEATALEGFPGVEEKSIYAWGTMSRYIEDVAGELDTERVDDLYDATQAEYYLIDG